MAKGKGKKNKKKTGEEKPTKVLVYELISIEENFKEELNQNSRLQVIKENQNIFKEFQEKYDAILEAKAILDEWLSYLNCDHIPKAFIPNSIRDFFYKQLYLNEETYTETYNWLLNVDERSILTQDIDAVDKTKKEFLRTKSNDIGMQYENLVEDDIELLHRISQILNSKKKEHPRTILEDIKSLEVECKNLIKDFYDEYTYRVLYYHDATLEYVNSHTDHYFFSTFDFQIYIWSRKDFEITFDHDHPPHLKIPVTNIAIIIHIPLNKVRANRVFRCLHLNYDHYSNLTRSFGVIDERQSDELDQDDFIAILNYEWKLMRDIQKEIWQKMKDQRIAYEQYILEQQLLEEASKSKKKDDKKPKKKPKKNKKWPIEPAVITANTLPVVHKDFILEDERIYQSFLQRTDPINYNLEPHEINLRKYELKEGIFEIFAVIKPKTTVFPNRIMTWHYKNSKLQYEILNCDRNEELHNMYKVSFILPEHLIRWKLPLICQWEKEQKINYDSFEEDIRKSYNIIEQICVLKDFRVNKLLNTDEKANIVRHVPPRTISSFKFDMERQMDNPEDDVRTIKRAVDINKTEEEVDLEIIAFKWKNPERLFPLVKPCQKVQLLDLEELDDLLDNNEPKTLFSDVLDEIEVYNSKLPPLFSDINDQHVEVRKKSQKFDSLITPKKSLFSMKSSIMQHMSDRKSRATQKSISALLSQKSLVIEQEPIVEEEEEIEEEVEEEDVDIEPKWTTKFIFHTEFDEYKNKLTITTDRLGVFAWAFDRYIHFPFKKWKLGRDKKEETESIAFFLETPYIYIYIWVSNQGFKGSVTMWMEQLEKYKTILKFDKIENFQKLKKLFLENYFNIFPEEDAYWYVEDKESFSVKHIALENHTYDCMAYTCTSIQYDYSVWNFLSNRRTIILDITSEDDTYTLKITPENVLIVEIKELCNMLETVDLEYTPTWKNIDFTPDLLSLINSLYSYLPKVTDHNLFVNLSSLFKGIRFLSYS